VAEDFPGHVIELDGVTRPELVAALVAAGVGVQTVAPRRRLEDAFLDLLDHEQSL
jgi:ABC-2 type transport system ATP-binding protein